MNRTARRVARTSINVAAALRPAPTTRTVLITGMHRSGTSATAGIVRLLGVSLGDQLLAASESNPTGYWECLPLARYQDDLLSRHGGSWDHPPALSQPSLIEIGRARRVFSEALGAQRFAAWKDPRTALTLPLWRKALREPVLIVVFRNPLEVARSLEARNSMDIGAAIKLWELYNTALLDNAAGMPTLYVEYDRLLGDQAGVAERIRGFCEAAGIPAAANDSGVASFVKQHLRHTRFTDTDITQDPLVSSGAASLWERLRRIAGDTA